MPANRQQPKRTVRRPSPAPAEIPPPQRHRSETELLERVSEREARKLRARREGDRSAWFGLGMFGLVGWSVAVPAVAAIALGVWIDTRFPSQYSWTLMMLVIGVIVGCFNAWYWVTREREKLDRPILTGEPAASKTGDDDITVDEAAVEKLKVNEVEAGSSDR